MRTTILILSVWCSILAFGQSTAPLWCDDNWRAATYPRTSYVCGFVMGEVQAGESVEQTLQRIKEKAQAEAVQNITTSLSLIAKTCALNISVTLPLTGQCGEISDKSISTLGGASYSCPLAKALRTASSALQPWFPGLTAWENNPECVARELFGSF